MVVLLVSRSLALFVSLCLSHASPARARALSVANESSGQTKAQSDISIALKTATKPSMQATGQMATATRTAALVLASANLFKMSLTMTTT